MSRSDVDDSAVDFLGYGIKDPRSYKVVASSPRMVGFGKEPSMK
jgi:hypothetical protein